MTKAQTQIEIQSIIDGLIQTRNNASWMNPESIVDYLAETVKEVRVLTQELKR